MPEGIEVNTLEPDIEEDYIIFNGELTVFDSDKYDYALIYFIYDEEETLDNYKYTDIDHTTETSEFSYSLQVEDAKTIYYKAMCAGLQNVDDLDLAKDMIRYETGSISGNFEIVFYE